jgi:sestrin 1/3
MRAAAAAAVAAAVASTPSDDLRIETLRYRDFDTSEGMLITHDFSWEEHGFPLVARFCPSAAPALDRQFRVAFNLTYNKFSATGESVDTGPFRTAVWYYIQRLYGVRNDHYDYAMVNK